MKVFLSHSSSDKERIREIAKYLASEGIGYWLDEAEIKIGESLIEKVSSGLYEADLILAFLSWNSVTSEWVKKELSLAMTREIAERRVAVLPVLLEPCVLPQFLRDRLYADLSGLDGRKEMDKLLSSIRFHAKEDTSLSAPQESHAHHLVGAALVNTTVLDKFRKVRDNSFWLLLAFAFVSACAGALALMIPDHNKRMFFFFAAGCFVISCFYMGRGMSQVVDAYEGNPNLLAVAAKEPTLGIFRKATWRKYSSFHDYRWGVTKMVLSCYAPRRFRTSDPGNARLNLAI